MRAPFDRLIDVYWGLGYYPILTRREANVPARFVIDDAFLQVGEPFINIVGYITCDAVSINPPEQTDLTAGVSTLDFNYADLIAITAGGPVTHQVYIAELRTWQTGGDYRRSHVGPPLSTLPSPCSTTYHTEYRCWDQYDRDFVVERTGPTTWIFEEWTLTAEVLGPPGTGCFSRWVLTNGVHSWNSDYYGGESWSFYSPDGGTPITFLVIPL